MTLQGGEHVIPQRDLACLAVLGRRDLTTGQIAGDDETTCNQVDVIPRERQQLALT